MKFPFISHSVRPLTCEDASKPLKDPDEEVSDSGGESRHEPDNESKGTKSSKDVADDCAWERLDLSRSPEDEEDGVGEEDNETAVEENAGEVVLDDDS